MKKIAIINQKGGSGKTTTACNLGSGLSRLKKKILLIDLDPQAHLTKSLLGPRANEITGIYHFLSGKDPLRSLKVVISEHLDLIPSTMELAGVEVELMQEMGREFKLKDALTKIRQYDYCFIDCPPSLGLLTVMALTAAQKILIPLQVEYLALDSVAKMMETIDLVKARLNKDLEILGVLATRVDLRKRLNREILENARAYFKKRLFKTMIRENISLAEAPSYGQTIFEYSSMSHGSEDYMTLAREFLKKERES